MRKKLITILLPLIVLFACLGFTACENGGLPEKLATPQNLKIRGELLTWNEVDCADGYCVYIEDREYVAEGCSYDLSELAQEKKYTVEVMAYSDAGIAHSEGAFIRYVGREYATEGMVFQSYNDTSARVRQLAVEEDGLCAIPASWNGYTVTGFSQPDISSDTEISSQIKSLYLPSSIREIKPSLTYSFSNLENLVLRGEHEKFVTEDNCLIDKETNTLIIGCIGSVIPEYVTAIGDYAFWGRNIKSFTVPENIKQIGSSAFYRCRQLEEIELPERLEQSNFVSVFSGCDSLKKAKVPDGVEDLMKAFIDCASLVEVDIPEGAIKFAGTFKNCTSLKEVTLPESAQSLWGTFIGCSSLRGVRIPANVVMLDQTFVDCTSLKAFTVPKHVKELQGAFGGCTSLQSVAFEEGVEVLDTSLASPYSRGISSFEGCVALSDVKLPRSLTKIGNCVFKDCIKLESISIPENVTQIGRAAFGNCASLALVTLPEKLTTIESGAFKNCISLKEIELPESLTTIDGAFAGCTALRSIRIPNSVNKINASTFRDCSSLQSVTLSENASVISVRAFANCTSLQSIDICSTEVSIIGNAFEGCTALKSVVLPKRTKVQNYAFKSCPLEAVYYRGTEAEWEENAINIVKQYNSEILSAVRYYYSETAPALNAEGTAYEGNFWRYENGVPTVWEYQA